MKEKLINRLYDFWKSYTEYYNLDNKNLKENITKDVNRVWDICNWYLDYTQNNKITEKDLLELIENY